MPSADEKVTLIAKYLAMRLEEDEAFVDEMRADPRGTLTRYGLNEELMKVARESVWMPDCVDTTCWSSNCPDSCVGWTVAGTETTWCDDGGSTEEALSRGPFSL